MHYIELSIHKFLRDIQSKNYKIPEELLNKFSVETKDALRKQFEKEEHKQFTLRMSNVGLPLCILQMEKKYGRSSNTDTVRNLLGDLTEDIVLFLLHASGVNVVSELKHVSFNIGGIKLNGTLDVILDCGDGPEVWDIKSAAKWTFQNKYQKEGFKGLVESDPFGYKNQLFGYAVAEGIPAGGWIVINRDNGELLVVPIPKEQEKYRKEALKSIETNIKGIDKPFKRQFTDINETFHKKLTGNKILGLNCSFCDYKFECWPDLQCLPRLGSKAANPQITYYTHVGEANE